MTQVEKVLQGAYATELVTELLKAFREVESSFARQDWKISELDAGHFVEIARRIVEQETTGKHTPLGSKLPSFNTGTLGKYESGSGHESFRILIPRVLWATYAVRNKRGVAHVGTVSPNEMDATMIVANVRWVLAEIVRIHSGLPASETAELIHDLVQKDFPVIWSTGEVDRVLKPDLPAREKVLLLLYAQSPRSEEELRLSVEYKNASNFRKILRRLHTKRQIEYDSAECRLSPLGENEAEKLIRRVAAG